MIRDVDMHDAPAVMRQQDQDEQYPAGELKKSIDAAEARWFVRNVLHVCEGGRGQCSSRRDTVRSETSTLSVRSSP